VISYHCKQLEATGLILRERHGKSVGSGVPRAGTNRSTCSAR